MILIAVIINNRTSKIEKNQMADMFSIGHSNLKFFRKTFAV